jgi:regulator of sirC expression with transglutaminase-like and TPR domain
MIPPLPICAAPDAYHLLARQVASIHSSDALLHGAIAIAMHEMHNVQAAEIDRTIQGYADTIRQRVRGPQPQALLAHLHDYLFDELGFIGDSENYYTPSNSYLPYVLEHKRGLPITLAIVYRLVAERLGLRSWGVALPGHFLAAVEIDQRPMLVDPFAGGRLLTPDEAQDRLHSMFGPDVEWVEDLLAPASTRHWLTRMLQNLLNIFGAEGRYADVAAMLEMEMLLWPDQHRLQRDLALVLARIGMSRPASLWLENYLSNNPDDPQEKDLKQLLDVLGA